MKRLGGDLHLPEEQPGLLLSEQQVRGKWWLPGSPAERVSGTLSFVPFSGITLDLIGSMPRPQPSMDLLQSDVILGEAANGTPFTLLNAFENHWQSGPSGGRSTWTVNYALVGKHYKQHSDLVFATIAMRLTSLEQWLSTRPISLDAAGRSRRVLTYELPEEPEIPIPGLRASLVLRSLPQCKQGRFSAVLAHANYLEVRPEKACSFAEASQIIHGLGNLLMLLQGDIVQMAELRMDDVDMLVVQQGDKPVGERWPHEMLFAFDSIKADFPQIVSLWFEECDLLRPVRTLFFSHYYNPSMYPEVHFLNLTQALESYHRLRHGGTYVPATQYYQWRKAMVGCIPALVPSALRESLKDRLKYANEFSLRRRLRDLLDKSGKRARDLITCNYDGFVDYVVTLRNYHTHYTKELEEMVKKKLKGRMPSGEDYIYLNWRLKAWLNLLLLADLGIAEDAVVERMQTVRRWQHYLLRGGN